jgi:hypothetical protein
MNQISSPCVKTTGIRADEDLNKYGLDNSQRRTEHSIWNRSGSTPSLAGFIMSDRMVPSCIQIFHSRSLLAEDILSPSDVLLWLMYYTLTSYRVFCCVARNRTVFFFKLEDFHNLLLPILLSRHQFVSEGACDRDFRQGVPLDLIPSKLKNYK